MGTDKFFDETSEQSTVKVTIVSKYISAWAKVILPSAIFHDKRIAYIDLFAGRGSYKDGTKSTPHLVLEQAVQDPNMCQTFVSIFNDKDHDNYESLKTSIKQIPDIDRLKYVPKVMNHDVGEDIIKKIEKNELVPTICFIDPWGYKGLSIRLLRSVLKDWGCECIFFFNYNRINMALANDAVKEHMDALFGDERANNLRTRLDLLDSEERENIILHEIEDALTEIGAKFVLSFCFKNDAGTRTSHHLIFATKHFRGYKIMKEIMAKESTNRIDGPASFQYSPADKRQPMLFSLLQPVESLEKDLLEAFAGCTLSMGEIYEKHSVGTPFIGADYKKALRILMESGKITTDRVPKRGSFADSIVVTFPGR